MASALVLIVCALLCAATTGRCEESLLDEASRATLAEDGRLNFTQLVTKYGQRVEEYDVVTEDGYILTIFRIVGEKPPVLLLHGLLDCADTFVMRGERAMGLLMARAGHDVWVGNNRGNLYGRRHVSLNPDTDKQFWDFSLQEVGYYDLPAMIDFVRNKTGFDKIATVGHSQGTSAHFVLGSLRPEYNEKINVFIALAPIAFLYNLGEEMALLARVWVPAVDTALELLGLRELARGHGVFVDVITLLCSKGLISYAICGLDILFPLTGLDAEALGPEYTTSVAIGHFPSAVSKKMVAHLFQIYLRQKFAQYDDGAEKNVIEYGSVNPPEYNVTAMTMKTALFVGKTDKLSTVVDVARLRDALPDVVHHEVMAPAEWGHLAFVSGKHVPEVLLPTMLQLLEKYNC